MISSKHIKFTALCLLMSLGGVQAWGSTGYAGFVAGNYEITPSATGTTAEVQVAGIRNTTANATTGSLGFELWYSSTPYNGGTIDGYKVAASYLPIGNCTSSQLGPGQSCTAITVTDTLTLPAAGTYYPVLLLVEFSSTCATNEGYCIDDYVDLTNLVTGGPTVTVAGVDDGGSGSTGNAEIAGPIQVSGIDWTADTVDITAASVTNFSNVMSGSLAIQLWFMANPYTGGAINSGYKVASFPLPASCTTGKAQLNAGMSCDSINSGTIAVTPPPAGTYYAAVVLVEYNPGQCSSNAGYCIDNGLALQSQETVPDPIPAPGIASTDSGGGGGSIDWLNVFALAALIVMTRLWKTAQWQPKRITAVPRPGIVRSPHSLPTNRSLIRVALITLFGLSGCGGGGGGSGASQVDDPNVQGDTQAAATSAITAAGLTVGTITMQASSTVPAGDVISETPAAGTAVSSGSIVNLIVSSGPAPVSVPNVVGDTQAAATTAIAGAGLVAGTVTPQSSTTVASGNIISESPAAGASVPSGSAVNLVVSSGVSTASVPNVLGTTQAAATSAITAAGLVVGTVTMQASALVISGNIISENPAAGTNVSSGSAVNLVVSNSSSSGGYTLGGTVTGLATAQLSALVLSDGITATSPTASTCTGFCTPGSPFVFSALPTGTSYSVSVVAQPPGETCAVTQGATGILGASNVTGVAVSCLVGSWALLSTMPVPRGLMAVAVLNNLIYTIGGVSNPFASNQACYDSVTVYDPSTDVWSFAAPYPVTGFGIGAVAINGNIYAFGGTDCNNNNNSVANVYKYDPIGNSWTAVSAMPYGGGALTNVGVGTDGTNAFIFGGINAASTVYSQSIQVYDPAASTWTSPNFIAPPMASAAAVWVNGSGGGGVFTIIPGYGPGGPLSTGYQYFPDSNAGFSYPVPFATDFPAVAAIGSTIYAAVANYASAPQFYQGPSQSVAPPTVQQIGASAAVVNGIFYLIGGLQQSQTGSGTGALEAYQP